MKKILISGNEAIGAGAIQAGCRFYAGYPITPQNELTAYMAKYMPESGGVFIQAEAEVSAINMVFGAAATGERAMTSSSSPGISLKQEGISYIAGAELPAVIVNVMRAGPGLGNIWPAQSDYFQATKGGGHGDYHCIVLAPSTVQESFDFMAQAFDLADKYRNPVMILSDGMLGQMMEPIEIKDAKPKAPSVKKPWAVTGCKGRERNIAKSFHMIEGDLEQANLILQKKYHLIERKEQQSESGSLDDADVILVAYGSMARIAKSAAMQLRKKGKKIGYIRPISLWPFPSEVFKRVSTGRKKFLVVEMSYGQMVEDVRLAVNGKSAVEFLGRSGGGVVSEEDILKKVRGL
ncbi:MAG: 3-methyl-2-oxobutanoate dehydrogenase subunit VorB [Candidatus Omnitrophica bacterium]|nr:3-methyl-2-oxobutanoate dehydrogenase subunit VorB [Candidatus Omnitrophota bacterium]